MARHEGVGLALAGGVVEGGFYEVGVLCALADSIDGLDLNALDVYVGVSAGAIIGSLLANGVTPRTLSRAILEQSGDSSLDLRPDVIFTPAWREYLDRVRRIPGVVGRTAQRLVSGALGGTSGFGLLTELGPLVPTGIFDGRGLEAFLRRAFSGAGRTNDFRDLAAKLRIVAVHLDTSDVKVFGGLETAHVPISRAVQASSALPGLFSPVTIDGEQYIDGVARRTMNASLGLREGARLMLCINPIVPVKFERRAAPRDGAGRRTLHDYGLWAVLSQTFRTMVQSRMAVGFRDYEHSYPGSDLVLIEPAMEDNSLFFSNIFSFSNRRGVTEHAYQSTRRWLLEEADRLEPVFARHGLTLRRDVLQDQSRTLYGPEETPLQQAARTVGETAAKLDEAIARFTGRRTAA
jgi:predicted acylesterase/phospholipase RssA